MSLYVLSSRLYENPNEDYGDCFVIIHNRYAVIFDCGSEEHATEVVELLKKHDVNQVDCVLSHNDDDHYKGFPLLIEKININRFFTVDVKKHKREILDVLNDGRRKLDSFEKTIDDEYDNISELSESIKIYDVYSYASLLPSFVKFIGPEKDYFIEAAAKGLDSREGDSVDNTTFKNASSIQLKIDLSGTKILLTGDCAVKAIPENVKLNDYDYIQIPHHGNEKMADELFERVGRNNDIVYLISDNKGAAKGGSDDLVSKGYKLKKAKNTKDDTIRILDGVTTKNSYIPHATMGL